jgi:hypothetical protein
MNLIDYAYYNVYRWYYEMKQSGRRVDPSALTSTVFGISFGGLCLLFFSFYTKIGHKGWPEAGWILIVALCLFISWLTDLIYTEKNRAVKVFAHFNGKKVKKSNIFFVFLFLFSPFLFYVLSLIIFANL